LGTLDAPQNISALTTVTQDNTGKFFFYHEVKELRNMKYFFDGTVPAYASPGGIVEHTYKEGIYDAKILDLLLMVKKLK
jgi:hypothetical protein